MNMMSSSNSSKCKCRTISKINTILIMRWRLSHLILTTRCLLQPTIRPQLRYHSNNQNSNPMKHQPKTTQYQLKHPWTTLVSKKLLKAVRFPQEKWQKKLKKLKKHKKKTQLQQSPKHLISQRMTRELNKKKKTNTQTTTWKNLKNIQQKRINNHQQHPNNNKKVLRNSRQLTTFEQLTLIYWFVSPNPFQIQDTN